ncbi:MAG: sigma 54-interacting transcriptional regulator [Sporolactobacillus sp.]|jgi:transcriptional regulatory protein LevR/transcriptional regulator with AAA-type ATPase domain|nr:sigma 54-interacting transcriptional regulator [Sporolactobacillus sp.]
MTRKQKIYDVLKELCLKIDVQDLESGFSGYDTATISEMTGFVRPNVSKELNKLVKEQKVIKIKGRPIYYFDKQRLQMLIGRRFLIKDEEVNSIQELIHHENQNEQEDTDLFHQLIGAAGSLDIPIKQAKAAIFYPPKGLHTLLIGPTGSGKTTFAEIMYHYAITAGTLKADAQFIIFNCAEYADNPQLILSQLFGYVKGAFTGADKEKTGLIEKADGGILLLDEVHRLPPEAQEMLFMLIDKNKYRRVGETNSVREANVLLIAATTENVNSVLLKTFLRRFPMVIKLTSLSKRTLTERYQLINNFFAMQSEVVQVPIRVYQDVIKALLLYDCMGNVGQLKSDIQLICARGFLEYKTQKKVFIEVDTPLLPEHVYDGLLHRQDKRDEVFEMIQNSGNYFEFPKQKIKSRLFEVESHELTGIYFELTNKYNLYSKRGYSRDKINQAMNQVIEKYLNKLLKKIYMQDKIPEDEKIFKVISPRIYWAVKDSLSIAAQQLKKDINRKSIIALAMHIQELPERQDDYFNQELENISKIAINYPDEYQTAKIIRRELKRTLAMPIPEVEEGFIAMFLHAIDAEVLQPKIGVVILAHGISTASSMAAVCNALLSTDHCKAIDMPLDEKIEIILAKTVDLVNEIDEGKGILLLVDMGSLAAFDKIIEKRTGIATETVQMVSTPLALEAVRKCLMSEMTLSQLTEDLNRSVYQRKAVPTRKKIQKRTGKTIVTTCMTSAGTAVKLANIIQKSISSIRAKGISVQPMTLQKIKDLNKGDLLNIIAFVGSIDPKISNIPFVPTDEIIIGEGMEHINRMICGDTYDLGMSAQMPDLSMKVIADSLNFLNPAKACSVLISALNDIVAKLNMMKTDRIKISFLMHCTCMIERVLRKEPLPFKDISMTIRTHMHTYQIIKKSLKIVEDTYGVIIPDTEIGYIIDMVDTH